MDRAIKFQGLRVDGAGWAFGDFRKATDVVGWIREHDGNGYVHPVERRTVGQFTGMVTRDENDVYEGDIVRGESWLPGVTATVYWDDVLLAWRISWDDACDDDRGDEFLCDFSADNCDLKIIGNIHGVPRQTQAEECDD